MIQLMKKAKGEQLLKPARENVARQCGDVGRVLKQIKY